ncbi:Pycsar system effector family protein [Castellaniella sp.]|uniref:Pycsar system effector family protein n=1 Tax=Castellaniella sp. TaxID=1955812 RepID=UPI003A913B76
MSAETERLQTAQWVLERNLAWIAAAEVKVGVIVAIDTAMLGGLGVAFSAVSGAVRTHCDWLFAIAATICLGGGLFCAAMAVLPRVTGPARSLLFFGRVGPRADAEYIDDFKMATDADFLEDWTAQIHRNAQIACDKFAWVRKSMWWSFLSVPSWFPAIITLLNNK